MKEHMCQKSRKMEKIFHYKRIHDEFCKFYFLQVFRYVFKWLKSEIFLKDRTFRRKSLKISVLLFSNFVWARTISAVSGYLRLFQAILGYLRLSQAISGYLGLSQAISGYLWLSRATSDYLRLSWNISDYLRLSWTILDNLGQSQTISDYL